MRPTESTTSRINSQTTPRDGALLEQSRLVLFDLELLESEIRNARGISRNLWWGWRGHRRTIEDLAAIIHQERAA